MERRRLRVSGTVQGVGFRPFVHRLAQRSGLTGAVGNDEHGVWCEVQGPEATLDAFTAALRQQAPPLAVVREIETEKIAVIADEDVFVIVANPRGASGDGLPIIPDSVPPDALADDGLPVPQALIPPAVAVDDGLSMTPAPAPLDAAVGGRPPVTPASVPPDAPVDDGSQIAPTSVPPAAAVGTGLAMTPASIPPDAAVCEACSAEISDPADRRFGYAFTCCTDCGPRYTVVRSLPYDRERTSMAEFDLCRRCRAEYNRPGDRRHHAQATCCPDCGPALELRDREGRPIPGPPVETAAELIAAGQIVAVKGLGGYQLVCRADAAAAVMRLRAAKNRYEKPFALLVAGLDRAEALVELDEPSRRALTGPERPIVLAERRRGAEVCEAVTPDTRRLGVMLPAAPLHQLLASAAPAPLVCTSGNRSDEPIAIDDADAADRLAPIADAFLAHDRRIERRADDSVGVAAAGRFRLLRRARGFVPRPVRLGRGGPAVLGVGAEMKSTVCLGLGDEAHLSGHLGDLEDPFTLRAFETAVADLLELSGAEPALVVHDRHPEYLSAKFARSQTLAPAVGVQHHHAHLAACLADNAFEGPAIGVIFDGLGWGDDGTLWGGEFLVGDATGVHRAAHLAPVPLPGGTAAIREPWRMAVSHLVRPSGPAADLADPAGLPGHSGPPDLPSDRADGLERSDAEAVVPSLLVYSEAEVAAAASLLGRSEAEVAAVVRLCAGDRSLATSSVGRLFDAVAALCGLAGSVSYDGQAAARLEQAAAVTGRSYRWDLPGLSPQAEAPDPGWPSHRRGRDLADSAPHGAPMRIDRRADHDLGRPAPALPVPIRIDPAPVVEAAAEDCRAGVDPAVIAGAFHAGLAGMIVGVCERLRDSTGVRTAALSGGVFQNRLLVELAVPLLEAAGFEVLLHSQAPPNDGGISLGQVAVGRALLRAGGRIDDIAVGGRR